MTILRRYLARHLMYAWALVLGTLLAVFGLLLLISEMERVGDAYHVSDAALFVVFSLPQQMLELMPVVVLLGTMLALVNLESGSELTIIGSTGVGVSKLLQMMVLPILLLMIMIWLAEEYITPSLHRYGEEHKALTYGSVNAYLDQASWSRDDSRYVHLGSVDKQGQPHNIDIYIFNDEGGLERAIHAQRGEVVRDRLWMLHDLTLKDLVDGKLTTRSLDTLEMDNLWSREELPTLMLSSGSMPPSVLYRYGQFLKQTGQRYEHYDLAFWKRITLPFNCAAMLVLATPIGGRPGSARNASIGLQLGLGALIGIFFYLGSQIIYALGLIMNWHPGLICLIPIVAILLLGLVLLWRNRW